MDVMGQESNAVSQKNSFSRQAGERIWNGLIKENPTFVLMLGMCPTLAVTTSAINGLGMGLTTAVVLAMSNLLISLLRNIIPNKVRIPAFIVVIASFVTILQLILEGYIPFLNEALGVYIPLIVVNCIILGRAESYASLNPPLLSLLDGIGMGLGFTIALTCIGAVRELLGAGKLFNFQVMPDFYTPIGIFVLAPGAFFVLAALAALQNYVRDKKGGKKNTSSMHMGCMGDCNNCSVADNIEHLEAVDHVAHNQKEQHAKSDPKDAKRKGKEE
jgi:electron transport complex protein RnfE